MEDARLIREFRRTGDQASFGSLVDRHKGAVFRLVLSILGPGHEGEAEELTQDVFLKVFQKLGQLRAESTFRAWLFRIAFNRAIDHRSRLGFRAVRSSEEVLEMTPSDRREADPFEVTVDSRLRSVIEDCVNELPNLYRSVVHLHYWMGMTVPEISRTLSTREGTVKSYLFRARARLQRMLQERGVTDV